MEPKAMLKTHILIVDDNKSSRTAIRSELEQEHYQIHEADSGKQALQTLMEQNIQLITMDVGMPEMDGYETCRKIREWELDSQKADPKIEKELIPVIFLTAHDNFSNRSKGFTAGGTDFIGKNFANGELSALIKTILSPDKKLSGMNAIVADENGITRRITSAYLNKQGVLVKEFDDSDSAYLHLAEHGEDIDLFILEFELKQLNNLKLCQKIRKELSLSLPIIVISENYTRETMLMFFQYGATDYLFKPYLKEELIARLNSHLENRKLHKSLMQHNIKLQAINQLKDRFISACSHDLRTPMNAILGFTDLLKSDIEENKQHLLFLDKIEECGNSFLEYVDELLEFTNFQVNGDKQEFKEVDLDRILKQCIPELEVIAGRKSIAIKSADSQFKNSKILGVENHLKRLIHNLVINAIKFSNKHSSISIEIEELENKIAFTVADQGIGIPQEELTNFFTQSFNFNRPGTQGEKSTGLGLKICKQIVDNHKAFIEVASKENNGSVFTVRFDKIVRK